MCIRDSWNIFIPYNKNMAKKKQRGRPTKKKSELLKARIEIRLLPDEKREIEDAAESANLKLSEWIRQKLLTAARERSGKS